MISSAELWLFRHGHAKGADDSLTRAQDAARVLSPKGVKQSQRAAKVLQGMADVDSVYTSPAVRCAQGAAIIGSKVGVVPVVKTQLAEPPASGNILPLAREGKTVVIVGHGHYFPEEIKKLTGKSIDMDKGGLLSIRITRGQGRVEQMFNADDIAGMA